MDQQERQAARATASPQHQHSASAARLRWSRGRALRPSLGSVLWVSASPLHARARRECDADADRSAQIPERVAGRLVRRVERFESGEDTRVEVVRCAVAAEAERNDLDRPQVAELAPALFLDDLPILRRQGGGGMALANSSSPRSSYSSGRLAGLRRRVLTLRIARPSRCAAPSNW